MKKILYTKIEDSRNSVFPSLALYLSSLDSINNAHALEFSPKQKIVLKKFTGCVDRLYDNMNDLKTDLILMKKLLKYIQPFEKYKLFKT